jgi:hypothetical protein
MKDLPTKQNRRTLRSGIKRGKDERLRPMIKRLAEIQTRKDGLPKEGLTNWLRRDK